MILNIQHMLAVLASKLTLTYSNGPIARAIATSMFVLASAYSLSYYLPTIALIFAAAMMGAYNQGKEVDKDNMLMVMNITSLWALTFTFGVYVLPFALELIASALPVVVMGLSLLIVLSIIGVYKHDILSLGFGLYCLASAPRPSTYFDMSPEFEKHSGFSAGSDIQMQPIDDKDISPQ